MDFQSLGIFLPFIALSIATGIALYSWRRSRTVAIVVFAWAVLSLFTAQIPQSVEQMTENGLFGYFAFNILMVLPLILLLIALQRSSAFRRFMDNTPTWVLTATQLYRLSGATLLVLYLQGFLPVEIGLSNGVQDIFIGLTALPLAWVVYRRLTWSRHVAIVWNLMGLLDFVTAGVVISLAVFGVAEFSPEPTRMGLYPLSLISVYQVVIAIFIHVYLLRRLLLRDVYADGEW